MSPFHHLGLAPDAGEREVKRAYAKALKLTRPDEDPVAFQALNETYQAALAIARAHRQGEGSQQGLADGEPMLQVQFQMQVPEQGPVMVPMAVPVAIQAAGPDPASVRGFDFDAFLRDFALHCQGHPGELVAWLEAVEALYDIDFKHQVAAALHDWLVHDSEAPMLRSGQYEDLDRFFAFDFSGRLVPLAAARWAIAREKTTRYGERRPLAIRQLKRPFGWARALLIGAMPGMNRRLGLLAWGLARDFGGLPPGIDQRQFGWYTRLADAEYLGRGRWLSIAASSVFWGATIAAATLAVIVLTGGAEPLLLPLVNVAAFVAAVLAALQAAIALARYLLAQSRASERMDWWLGAGLPLGLALLALAATGLSNPVPAGLCAASALLLAIRHRSRLFDALRLFLASAWMLVAVGTPDGHLPVLAAALAAVGFVVLDSAHALRHALPFRATLGNRWTRIGSYVVFASALVLPLVIPMARS